jgi:hypothetical protein
MTTASWRSSNQLDSNEQLGVIRGMRQVDELARVERAGSRVFREARRTQYAFARRNWLWLCGLAATCLSPNLLSLLYRSQFQRGLILGITATGAGAVACWSVIMATGTAATLMGANAERFTADELKGLDKHGFRVVHHGAFRPGDVDHIVIGPPGVFVLETKWRSGSWSDLTLEAARRQVGRNANDLRLVAKRFGITRTTPVVVSWGPQAHELETPALGWSPSDESAVVLPGLGLRRWLLSLAGGTLTAEQIESVRGVVAEHAARRDLFEEPAPTSVIETLLALWRAFAATWLALAIAFPITWLPPIGDLATSAVGLMGALALRRRKRWRIAGTAAATVTGIYVLATLFEILA